MENIAIVLVSVIQIINKIFTTISYHMGLIELNLFIISLFNSIVPLIERFKFNRIAFIFLFQQFITL